MKLRALALATLLVLLAPAQAALAQVTGKGLAADITEEEIAVDSNFRGAQIRILGAAPARQGDDFVVVLRGPGGPVEVARKKRVFGLWLAADPVTFQGAPAFFAVITERPLLEIASERAIWELGLDPAGATRLEGETPPDSDPADYRAALVRLKRAQNLYQEAPRGLRVTRDDQIVLFQANVALPANAPPGEYRYEVYRFRNGRLVASESAPLPVLRRGIERLVHDVALRFPALYGMGAVALALGAGWLASFIGQRRSGAPG